MQDVVEDRGRAREVCTAGAAVQGEAQRARAGKHAELVPRDAVRPAAGDQERGSGIGGRGAAEPGAEREHLRRQAGVVGDAHEVVDAVEGEAVADLTGGERRAVLEGAVVGALHVFGRVLSRPPGREARRRGHAGRTAAGPRCGGSEQESGGGEKRYGANAAHGVSPSSGRPTGSSLSPALGAPTAA